MEAGVSDMVARPPAPPVVLPLWGVAEELGVLVDNSDSDSDPDIEIGSSSPLAARARRRLGGSWTGSIGPG